MGFLQQFHLVIKYTKGASKKVADMLSHPPISISTSVVLQNVSLLLECYVEQYVNDDDFKEIYEKLCIPIDERVHVIQETHTSLMSGQLGAYHIELYTEPKSSPTTHVLPDKSPISVE